MRVAVTGASGNVGTSLLRLLAEDPEVTALTGVSRRVPDDPPGDARWVAADIAHDDLTEAFAEADAVVHLAWLLQPMRRPAVTWEVNVRGTAKVLDAAARAGATAFVYASSVGAYSPADGRKVDEAWPTHGVATCAYSREKAYVERMLDAFERENPRVRVVRLRPSLIFKRGAASHVRRLFLGSLFPNPAVAAAGLLPTVRGLRFQCVHTDDVAEAYRQGLMGTASGAFNVSTEEVLTLADVAACLDARTIEVPARLARAATTVSHRLRLHPVDPGWVDLALRSPLLDTTRARRELGWAPRRSAHDTLAELLGGVRERAGGGTPPLRSDDDVSRVRETTGTRQGADERP